MTPRQLEVLVALASKERALGYSARTRELWVFLGRHQNPSVFASIVDRMERKGVVERVDRSPRHGIWWSLTAKGRRILESARQS